MFSLHKALIFSTQYLKTLHCTVLDLAAYLWQNKSMVHVVCDMDTHVSRTYYMGVYTLVTSEKRTLSTANNGHQLYLNVDLCSLTREV